MGFLHIAADIFGRPTGRRCKIGDQKLFFPEYAVSAAAFPKPSELRMSDGAAKKVAGKCLDTAARAKAHLKRGRPRLLDPKRFQARSELRRRHAELRRG